MELTCKPPLKDDPEYTREIVRIHHSIFQKLQLEEFDYVKLIYKNENGLKVRVKKITENDDGGMDIVRLKKRYRNIIDIVRLKKKYRDILGAKDNAKVEIKTIEENRRVILNTFYAYAKDKNERIVRIHQNKLKELGIKSDNNNTVEVFNLNTGGRLHAKLKELSPDEAKEVNRIRLDAYMRSLLDVEKGDEIGVRKSLFEFHEFNTVINKIEKFFINYNTLILKVSEGEDSDEGKNVVRTNKSNINLLGTEKGDIVDVWWQNKSIQCRILENINKGIDQNNQDIIYICSSERAYIDLDVYDCVCIRRSPNYILKKNILEPFIGAIITGFGLFLTFDDLIGNSAWAISLFVSVLSFYIILSKVRSQV